MSIKNTLDNAKKLGLSLKNIKTFEGHDTMTGFNADVYIDGKKMFHVFDSAHGGCYEYTPCRTAKLKHNEVWKITDELETKLSKFPKHKVDVGGGQMFESRDNLDCVIGGLFSEYEYQKDIKKDKKKGLLIQSKSGDGYSILKWKAGTIANMLKKYEYEKVITIFQDEYDKQVADGKVILNKDYLKSVGVIV